MKNIKKELLSIAATLFDLGQQVEKIVSILETEEERGALPIGARKRTSVKEKKRIPERSRITVPKKTAAPKKTTEVVSADTILNNIYTLISRSRNGITIDRIKKQTGLEARQVSNALYKLTKKEMVKTISRGRYIKKKS
ncbi:hypothetical protein LJC71_02975 [Desulfosarcina sp. OttesenSCG-928-A07]|nr:hypothetical protein [Desulfosarcina sp. OttesenSCG-928-G17]MDL2328700.1 hypothetical protein [Desulfosarcina sp. OttesenSCG-928-A07]